MAKNVSTMGREDKEGVEGNEGNERRERTLEAAATMGVATAAKASMRL
jgi:hypothetical protein